MFLPNKFYLDGNSSIYTLLKETGYFDLYNQIREEDILEEIDKKSDCINQWLEWSENKRSNSGCYIKKDFNKNYIVGYYDINNTLIKFHYSDVAKACAAFIKFEIEEIRKS